MSLKEKIIELNKGFGGNLARAGSLDFACNRAEHEKNVYRKCAYLIRAIVVDHPFSDGNKSSAIAIVIEELYKENIDCNEESLTRFILRIAQNNTSDLIKIERGLRKCCQKM